MSNYETVKIVRDGSDINGTDLFKVVDLDGYTERGQLTSYKFAAEVAARIDARNIYERDNGAGSLEQF